MSHSSNVSWRKLRDHSTTAARQIISDSVVRTESRRLLIASHHTCGGCSVGWILLQRKLGASDKTPLDAPGISAYAARQSFLANEQTSSGVATECPRRPGGGDSVRAFCA